MTRPPESSGPPPANLARKNTVILSTYYTLESALLFFLNLVLARYLGVSEFGRLSFGLAYGLIFSVLSDPGISLTLTKFVARDPTPANKWIVDGLSCRLYLIAVTCALAFVILTSHPYLRSNAYLLSVLLVSEQVRGLTLTYCAIFRGFQVMTFEAIALAAERVTLLVGAFFLLRMGYPAETVGLAFLGSRILSLVVAVLIFRRRYGTPPLTMWPSLAGALFRESLPLGVLVLAERVNLYVIPLVLTLTAGEYATGLFQSAFKIVTFPILVCGVVGGSLYSVMSASFAQTDYTRNVYRYGIRMLWHVLMPCAVLTLLFAKGIIVIIYGDRYGAAASLLQTLTPYYLLAGLITLSYYLMPAINHQGIAMKLSVASILLNLAVGIPMMHRWGPLGGALTLLLTNSIIAAGYWWYAAELGYPVFRFRHDLYQWGGFLGTLGFLYILKRRLTLHTWSDLFVVGTIAFCTYGVMLVTARGLLPEEVEFLSSLRSRIWR